MLVEHVSSHSPFASFNTASWPNIHCAHYPPVSYFTLSSYILQLPLDLNPGRTDDITPSSIFPL